MKSALIILVALAVFWMPDYLWAMSQNKPAAMALHADVNDRVEAALVETPYYR